MPTGHVKFYKQNSYGFIVPDGELGERDVYVHWATLRRARIEKLEPGQKVQFEIQPNISGGRPRARHIEIIENGAAA
jgi:cold shock CspA family protein